jgi:hypothetical protein
LVLCIPARRRQAHRQPELLRNLPRHTLQVHRFISEIHTAESSAAFLLAHLLSVRHLPALLKRRAALILQARQFTNVTPTVEPLDPSLLPMQQTAHIRRVSRLQQPRSRAENTGATPMVAVRSDRSVRPDRCLQHLMSTRVLLHLLMLRVRLQFRSAADLLRAVVIQEAAPRVL